MRRKKKARGTPPAPKPRPAKKSKPNTKALLHDLLTHQTELEIQNEELRTVQENLEAAIQKYSNYYEFAPVAYFTLDSQGKITETNLRGAAMVDTPRLQLIGTPFSRWVLPEQRHLFHQFLKDVNLSTRKQKSEFRLLRHGAPGLLVLVEAVSAPEAKNPLHLIRLILTDITEQRDTENRNKAQSLSLERDRLKGLLDAMSDGVCIVGPKGDVEYANQTIELDFGPADNRKCADFFHDDSSLSLWNNRVAGLEGKTVTWEWFSPKNNRTYEVFATTVKDSALNDSRLMFFHDITEKREIALALQNARKYLDGSAIFMVALDAGGKVTLINKRGCEVLELTQEAVLGKNWFTSFISENSRKQALEDFNRYMAGPSAPSELSESDIQLKNGAVRTFQWSHTLIKDDAGVKLGIVSTGTDISEQKAGEKVLKRNHDPYRAIVETTLEGIWVYDKQYRISYANERMAQLMGCDIKQLINQSVLDFQPETEKAYLLNLKDDRRKKGIREKHIRKKDGSRIWVLESASPLYSKTGDHIGTLGMLTDISARKQTEEALRSDHKKMSRRIEDQSAQISYHQQALEEIYRISTGPQPSFQAWCDQMTGSLSRLLRLPSMSLHIKTNDELRLISKAVNGASDPEGCQSPGCSLLSKVVDSGQILHVHGDLRTVHPDCHCGLRYPFLTFLGIPIKNAKNELIGVLCGLDIEKRVFTDDELHLMEIFSKYLTHELERLDLEKQLHQSQQLKMLGQLTSGVAHEVRNPLNAITAVTESLFQDLGNRPEYQTHMLHIRNQVERLSNLMIDLLELGRPINKSKLSDVSIASVISGVMTSWQHLPLKDKCKIRLLLPSRAKLWTMKADSGKLQQVFLNLLQNAAQHSPEHSEITFLIHPPINGRIAIKIIDQGTGIATRDREHLFEPFYTTRKGGIGLGLSIVKHILDVHGGGISLTNNAPPPGLTVTVNLWLSDDSVKEKEGS